MASWAVLKLGERLCRWLLDVEQRRQFLGDQRRVFRGLGAVPGAALHDRPVEEPGAVQGQQCGHAHRAGGLAGDGDAGGVAAERGDVVLDPLQREELVEQAPVGWGAGQVGETFHAQPVVDRHADDAVTRERGPVIGPHRVRAGAERAAVDPDHDGQP
jgi:hypothetical protein